MILVIGEVLTDIFPEYTRIGGAPFNFCFHLRRMGFDARFASRLGEDAEGERIRRFMNEQGIADDLVQRDPRHPTGVVRIELDKKSDARFDIVENAAYDFLEPTEELQHAAARADMMYFGTLMQRTAHGHDTIQRILACRGSSTACFYDVNLRPKCYSPEAVLSSLEHCDILKLNDDELQEVGCMLNLCSSEQDCVRTLMQKFDLALVACTRGAQGSTLFDNTGRCDVQPGTMPVIDTVGAGDAYAAVIAAGSVRGLPCAGIARAAAAFAEKICGIPGALPEGEDFYVDVQKVLKGEAV
jgi:fructokinase